MPKPRRLPPSVRKALDAAGVTVPQIAEIVGHFMKIAGGTQLFASMLHTEFMAAPTGSMTRQRILDAILRMMAVASNQLGTTDETDLLSPADLERELEAMLARVPDVPGEEEAGAAARH